MKNLSFIYILGNDRPTLYIGVTSTLEKRLHEHRSGVIGAFTNKYNLTKLLYLEVYLTIVEAIAREKQLKGWHREWKLNLIKTLNPDFKDLFAEFISKNTQILKRVQDDA